VEKKRIKHRPAKDPNNNAEVELHISNGRTLNFEELVKMVNDGGVLYVPNPHWLKDKVFPSYNLTLLNVVV
jgi:hypothetical protein